MKAKEAINYLNIKEHIKNPEVLDFTEQAIHLANEKFFTQPASMTGKYHPEYSLGEGGLLRHTKAAIILAVELFPLYGFEDIEKDYIISALTLHDIEKPDKLHPIMVKKLLLPVRRMSGGKTFKRVITLIESHMGQWNLLGKLPVPIDEGQKFVHLCDFLASRKSIMVNIE